MNYEWASCRYSGEMKSSHEDRAIPERLIERDPVPGDVFCYPAVDSWRGRIWALLGDVVTENVKRAFKRNPPEYLVSDDLTWLNEIVLEETGRDVEMKSLLADRLPQEYRAFRAGHGTRTNDLGQFYQQGLLCLRAEEPEARARELFMTADFAGVTEEKFAAAVADVDARKAAGGREGRLYFCADERSLMTRSGRCGHYLIYGGEYLYCLGIRLINKFDAQRVLKSIGRPTMLVCDIPMAMMRPSTLGEFAGSMLEFMFCELIGEQSHALSPGAGSAFSLTLDLPAEHILGHYHPARIYDPL